MKKNCIVALIITLLFVNFSCTTVGEKNIDSEYVLYDLKDLDTTYINNMQIQKYDQFVTLTYASRSDSNSDRVEHVICLYKEKSEIDDLYGLAIQNKKEGILDIEDLKPHAIIQLMIVYEEKENILSSLLLIKDSYGTFSFNGDEKVLEHSITLNNTGVNYIQKSYRKMPIDEIKWRYQAPQSWKYDSVSSLFPMTAVYEIRTDKDKYKVILEIGGD